MNKQYPELHSIQSAARLSGLSASTLRYYEEIGLLGPVDRDASSGHRRFSDDDLELAIAVACLSAAGMSISEMREYLANRKHGVQAADAQLDLLIRQRVRLRQEAQDLRLRRQYIDHKIDYWQAVASNDADALAVARDQVRIIAAALHAPKLDPQFDRDSERPE